MPRAALYARVSTDDQDAAPQLDRLREWATRTGHEVALERVEHASGRLATRPGVDDIMRAARGRRIQAVAVCKIDRWARSLLHLASSLEELHGLGTAFYAVDQGITIHTRDAAGRFTLNVLGAAAQFEAEIISERTKDKLRALKARGVKLGLPFSACELCGAPRTRHLRRYWRGRRVLCCPECKEAVSVRPRRASAPLSVTYRNGREVENLPVEG